MNTQHKLSATGKLAVLVGLAYAAPSFAANIEAVQGGAQVSQQKGVDIVNIVKPNEQGLSHNQYNKYNVSKSGAVLNNALTAGESKLAGQLGANSNFTGKAAEVILNEVVSKNPSLILGQQEVFGMAADYVLANPNGITYNGGDIINANRASLVVGAPEIVNGKLDHFNTNNNNALKVEGKLGGVSILDLVAPKVITNAKAKISADKAINVVSGSNKVGYTNGSVEKLARDAKAPVLDGQIFGSMNAGSIRIHATDDRATQTIKNAKISASDNLTADVAGDLHINTSKVSGGDITLNTKNTTIDGTVTTTEPTGPQMQQGVEAGNVRYSKQTKGQTQTFSGSDIAATGALNLASSGNVKVSGANVSADSLTVNANNVTANGVVTTNSLVKNDRRSKGLWHNNQHHDEQDQTIHGSQFQVKGDVNLNAQNALNLQSATIAAGNDVVLAGKNGISLTGNTATDRTVHNVDMRNETAKLKTGTSYKLDLNQEFVGTEITAGRNLGVNTSGALTTKGAQIKAQGDALVAAKKVNLGTDSVRTSNAVDDKVKYWGGLGGGKENGKVYTEESLKASSLVAAGNLLIDTKEGVNVSGSTVKGGINALVNAGTGALNVQAAKTSVNKSEKSRLGTIFNITKSSSSSSSDMEVVTGSTLQSDTNLKLASEKDVNVLGSALLAAQNVSVKTGGNLNIGTVEAKTHTTSSSSSIKGFAEGNAKASEKDGSVVAEATGGIGLRFSKNSNDTQTSDQVGSNVTAYSVDLNSGKDINISGSNVNADGAVNLTAKNVNTTAAQDVTVSNDKSRVTDVGLKATAGVTGYNPKVSLRLGVDSQYEEVTTTTGTAQVSNIKGGDVNINADNAIKHQGINVTATNGNVTQTAKTITNDVANNTEKVDKVQHAGGIFIGAGVSQSKGVEVSAGIYGNGGTAHGSSNTAVSGSLNANGDVTQNAKTVTDVATNYDVGGKVQITADQYNNVAAHSNSDYTANQGGASLTVSANSKDLTSVNVNAGLKVNYEHLNTESSTASIGTMKAGSVDITSKGSTNIASNIKAIDNVNITSTEGNVNFTQSDSTTSTTKAGVDVGLNVGAKITAAGAVLPKGGVSAEVTYGDSNASKGSAGTISTTAGNVKVTARDDRQINLNGTNIVSEGAVTLTAGEVNSSALTHKHDSLNVAAGGSLSLGTGIFTETTEHSETHMVQDSYCAPPREVTTTYTTEEEKLGINSAGFGLHADVVKENGVSHTANTIVSKGVGETVVEKKPGSDTNQGLITVVTTKPGGLTVNANNTKGTGITFTGTNVVATDVTLNAKGGNVNLTSAEGSLKRTGGGAGFSIEGDVGQDGFKPTAGDGYINVDLADNKTYTGSSINANKVNITSAGDLNLTSSTVTAPDVTAKVAGDVNITSQQNVVNETKVNLAAAGGKGIDPQSLTSTKDVTTTQTYDVVTNQVTVNACGCETVTPVVQTVTVEETHQESYVDGRKVVDQVFSDLQNGTILGTKAEAQIGVHVDKSKTSQQAGIKANNLNVDAGGNVNLKGGTVQYEKGTGFGDSKVTKVDNQDSSKQFDLGIDVGTNVPKMISYGVQHVTTGTSPLFHASSGSSQTVTASSVKQGDTGVKPVIDVKVTPPDANDPFDPFSQQTTHNTPIDPINPDPNNAP